MSKIDIHTERFSNNQRFIKRMDFDSGGSFELVAVFLSLYRFSWAHVYMDVRHINKPKAQSNKRFAIFERFCGQFGKYQRRALLLLCNFENLCHSPEKCIRQMFPTHIHMHHKAQGSTRLQPYTHRHQAKMR